VTDGWTDGQTDEQTHDDSTYRVSIASRGKNQIKLDGKYCETVQLPAKAKFGGFVANTWQHLPHLLLEV